MIDSKSTSEETLGLLRQLARTKDLPITVQDVAAGVMPSSASSPARIDRESIPYLAGVSGTQTDSDGAEGSSLGNASNANARRTAGRVAIIGSAVGCLVLAIGLLSVLLYRAANITHETQSPKDETAPTAVQPNEQASSIAPRPAASSRSSTDFDSVQQAMTNCDHEAAQNPKDLYLLVIPLLPNTDAAKTTLPQGEAYQTFFLMDSKAARAGLQDSSYGINRWPFAFSIINPTSGARKDWNLVAGVTQLSYAANEFDKFRVGFDVSGRGVGLAWSNEYATQRGVCYWINVRFRS